MATRFNLLNIDSDSEVELEVGAKVGPEVKPEVDIKTLSWGEECNDPDTKGFTTVKKKTKKFSKTKNNKCIGKIVHVITDKNGFVKWGRVERQDTHELLYFTGSSLSVGDSDLKMNHSVQFTVGLNHRGECATHITCM